VSWPIERCAELVIKLRGEVDANGTPSSGAAKRLWDALPNQQGEIARVLIGRDATEADKSRRIRILPLPSIGHSQVDRDIRRVLIEIPANCPLRSDDVAWAFSGLEVSPADFDPNTGEIFYSPQLVPAQERDMLRHYGIEKAEPVRTWRSVTPLALPEYARRRRIDSKRQREEAKNGSERRMEHERAAAAVMQALRHAGIRTPVWSIRVQREPFEAKGAHAESFAAGTRFDKARLWHVELSFVEPVSGPLVLGDGRYCGLGLMAPCEDASTGLYAFRIRDGLADGAEPSELAQALRRAVMARVQALLGDRQTLPSLFSGHAADGSPLRNGNHQHLAFVVDLANHRLLIVAPHRFEHRAPTSEERRRLSKLEQALVGLHELRAGAAGLLRLAPEPICAETDPLLARSCRWESRTPYLATRRAKRNAAGFMEQDIRAELVRRGFPTPTTIETRRIAHGDEGLARADVVVTFEIAVSGPILLGRDFHSGGGLFGGQTPTASLNPTASGV
jgi:CRISPR-associated protein Csb2